MYTTDEIIERVTKILQEMQGKDLATLCNNEFGLDVEYVEDGVFIPLDDEHK